VVHALIRQNLIDRYVISVIPVLLGDGIALFKPGRPLHQLRLVRTMAFPSGLVQVEYERG
jgi:dihydrofolate reductase